MTFEKFHNALRILRSIDAHELGNPTWWPAFCADPHNFIIRCDDETAATIWAVVEKRAGGPTLSLPATDMARLHESGLMLARWGDECFESPNEHGQRAMGALMMESAANDIIALFYPLRELCTHKIDEQAGCCTRCGAHVEDL